MAATIGLAASALAAAGLAVTARAQRWPMRRRGYMLDMLAIVPEWRFYAQASTVAAADLARDTHLVVRDRDAAGRVSRWRPILHYAERRLHHALWNPHARVTMVILTLGERLAAAPAGDAARGVQQALGYLVLLRRAFEVPRDLTDALDRQFAVVHTIGRGRRELGIDFLSAWHRW